MTRLGWIIIGTLSLGALCGWLVRGALHTEPTLVGQANHVHDESDVAHWTCPMHPSVKTEEPGPCTICGMDLQPVPKKTSDAGEENLPPFISLTPWQQQLIGVSTAPVERRIVKAKLTTVGRVVYDETSLRDVNLKTGGWIQELLVDYTGKAGKQGQALFTLYSPELVSWR